jgi:integrase
LLVLKYDPHNETLGFDHLEHHNYFDEAGELDGHTEVTGHGFRAVARTIFDEVLQVRPDFIEHQLAHAVRNPNGRVYNRTAHLVKRRKMMHDYLDKLQAGAEVIPFKGAGVS